MNAEDLDGWSIANEPQGNSMSPNNRNPHWINFTANILNDRLSINIIFCKNRFYHSTMKQLIQSVEDHLKKIIEDK